MTATLKGERPNVKGGTRNVDGSRTYSRVFLVETDNINDGPDKVTTAAGLPILGFPYSTETENDLAAIATEIFPEQIAGGWNQWEVTVNYTTSLTERQEQSITILEPTERPPIVTIGFVNFKIPAVGDHAEGGAAAIVASNQEPFDPPIQVDDSRMIVTVSRNEKVINPKFIFDMHNTVNSQDWIEAKRHQLKVKIAAQRLTDTRDVTNLYWRVTYVFEFMPWDWGWDLKTLNTGSYYVDASDGNKKKMFGTVEGQPHIQRLASNGDEIAADPNDLNATYTITQYYRERDFSAFKLEKEILKALTDKNP